MEYSIVVIRKEKQIPVEPVGVELESVETEYETIPARMELIVTPDKKAFSRYIRENGIEFHPDSDRAKEGAHITAAGETVFFFKRPPHRLQTALIA